MSDYPATLRYTTDHEWIDAGSPAAVGITAYAAEQLGDIVYVDLPEAGTAVTAGQYFGEIESVKSVSELLSPVTGTVVEVNAAVVDDPASVNEAPHEAWLVRIDVSAEGDLLDSTTYAAGLE